MTEPYDVRTTVSSAFPSPKKKQKLEMSHDAWLAWEAEKKRIRERNRGMRAKLSKIGRERMKGKTK